MLHIKTTFLARLKANIAWNVIKNLYLTWTAAGGQEQIENKGDFFQHLQFIMLLNSSYKRKPSFSGYTQGKPRFKTNHEALSSNPVAKCAFFFCSTEEVDWCLFCIYQTASFSFHNSLRSTFDDIRKINLGKVQKLHLRECFHYQMMPKDHIKNIIFQKYRRAITEHRPDPLDLEIGTFIFVLKSINKPISLTWEIK